MDHPKSTLLSVSNLGLEIRGTSILNSVSFEVRSGECLGIIGPNGSGKTSLFNCLSGFHLPSAGQIIYDGREITTLPSYLRARLGIGRVFQNFGIFREMTVIENIITALESREEKLLFPWSAKYREHYQRAMSYLDELGLAGAAKAKAGSLSGGQMRLLEIIRAIAFGAELFLLDEPTAGVSPKMKGDIEQVLGKLFDLKKTVLIIEHDMNFIYKLCDRIIVLDTGKVVLDDTPGAVRGNALLQEIYLGANNGDAANSAPGSRSRAANTSG